jgi:hypothetical protein
MVESHAHGDTQMKVFFLQMIAMIEVAATNLTSS